MQEGEQSERLSRRSLYTVNPTLLLKAQYRLRRPGHIPVRFDLCSVEKPGELLDLIVRLNSPDKMSETIDAIPQSTLDLLLEKGVIVRKEHEPREVSFDVTLNEGLYEWVPAKYLQRRSPSVSELMLNPSALLQLDKKRPLSKWGRLPPADHFPKGKRITWVTDPFTQMSWPYFLDDKTFEVVQTLLSGSRPIDSLNDSTIQLLSLAEILVSKNYWSEKVSAWETIETRVGKDLQSRQFAILGDLVPPLQIAAFRKYFRELESEGYLEIDQEQVHHHRFIAHNDMICSFAHRQTGKLISRLTGEPVFPSYSYLAAYLPGAILKKHIDRPQCRWNGSLLLDMNPETSRENSWPIYLEIEGKTEEVQMLMGECLIYRGTDYPHWRDALPEGQRQTLLLLHYVPTDFTGSIM